MTRLLLPLVLLAAAIGLFVVWINPTYQNSKGLQAQVASYDDALSKSHELRAVRDQLLSRRNTFSPDDVQKLQDILPDNVDNIRLIIDINNIASKHKLTLKDVQLGTVSGSRTAGNTLAAGPSGDSVGSVVIGFSVTASYNDMQAFLADLEHSLRLIDIEKMSFTTTANDQSTYSFNIRTYWLQ